MHAGANAPAGDTGGFDVDGASTSSDDDSDDGLAFVLTTQV